MPRCRVCGQREAEWSWQPLGPAKSPRETFATPGWHYRGFAAIPVCEHCKDKVQQGLDVQFVYKGLTYTCTRDVVLSGGDNLERRAP